MSTADSDMLDQHGIGPRARAESATNDAEQPPDVLELVRLGYEEGYQHGHDHGIMIHGFPPEENCWEHSKAKAALAAMCQSEIPMVDETSEATTGRLIQILEMARLFTIKYPQDLYAAPMLAELQEAKIIAIGLLKRKAGSDVYLLGVDDVIDRLYGHSRYLHTPLTDNERKLIRDVLDMLAKPTTEIEDRQTQADPNVNTLIRR